MPEMVLNKFEKEKRIIELHLQGKTIIEIAKEVHMSFTPISNIIKAYDKKVRLTNKKETQDRNTQMPKKLSLSSQAYKLFSDGKTQVEVAIDLNLDFEKVRKYWTEFLRLNNMKELYNIYVENEYHLDYLFKINYFMLRNKIPIKDCENILRVAYDTAKLYQTHSNLKTEIEQLKQKKNNYSLNQKIQPVPLGPLPQYYNW